MAVSSECSCCRNPPVLALLLPPPEMPANLDSRFDLHIFVDIYLHICIIVHICYGIFALLYMCKYLQGLQGRKKVGRCSASHMSKATDMILCEMINHDI